MAGESRSCASFFVVGYGAPRQTALGWYVRYEKSTVHGFSGMVCGEGAAGHGKLFGTHSRSDESEGTERSMRDESDQRYSRFTTCDVSVKMMMREETKSDHTTDEVPHTVVQAAI